MLKAVRRARARREPSHRRDCVEVGNQGFKSVQSRETVESGEGVAAHVQAAQAAELVQVRQSLHAVRADVQRCEAVEADTREAVKVGERVAVQAEHA